MVDKALTDGFVRAAKAPSAGRIEIRDPGCRGLVLRITKAGHKTWSFRYRAPNGGPVSRATIGEYPDVGLGAAREAADLMRASVARGGNPSEDKRRARTESNSRSFEHLAQRYMDEHAKRKKRSHHKDQQYLRLHVLPKWKKRDYRHIRRADVIELIEGLIKDGKATTANRVQSLIVTIFGFALDAGLMDAHPCARLKRRAEEIPSDRVLSDAEIRLFWSGIVDPQTATTVEAQRVAYGLRLALLTAARVSEVAGLQRSELENTDNAATAAWIIPGARSKNSREHYVPLCPLARDMILELLALISPDQQLIFPTRAKRGGPIRSNSLTEIMGRFGAGLDGDQDGVATWKGELPTPHDLRRTVETRLASLGVSKETRDRCLNHIGNDVGTRHYNRYDYAAEKRDAFTRWDAALSLILHGDHAGKVLQFNKQGIRV